MPWNGPKKKFTGPKKSSGKAVSKKKAKVPLDAKEYVEAIKVKKNVFPEALKFRTGLYIVLAAEYGDVAKRIQTNPPAETADIDLITLDKTKVNKDDYDFSVPAQVAEAQWKALKQEFLLRPTDLQTFDEMEDYLSEKSKLKDVVPDSSLFLEQNTEVSKPKVEKQKGEKFKGKKGGAEKHKGEKPKPGAVVNANSSGSNQCFLCTGNHKLKECKFLPMCQEVISTVKAKVVDKNKGKMQSIIAAAITSSVQSEPAKQEDDFNKEIASYFAPVLLAPGADVPSFRDLCSE